MCGGVEQGARDRANENSGCSTDTTRGLTSTQCILCQCHRRRKRRRHRERSRAGEEEEEEEEEEETPTPTMPKNKGKGGKNRRRGKNEGDEKRELIFKEEGQGTRDTHAVVRGSN